MDILAGPGLLVEQRWSVVSTHPHQERKALVHLQRQQFHGYCPLISKRVRHARQTKDVLRPLFPGYLFVRIDPEQENWRPILSTIGVRNIVRSGGDIASLDESFIEDLKARELDGVITQPENAFKVGQQVRVEGGPFDQLVATIIEMGERDRLTVLMDLLQSKVRVRLTAAGVSAL